METSMYCEIDAMGNITIFLSRYTVERSLYRCSPKQIHNMYGESVLGFALQYAIDAHNTGNLKHLKNKERLESMVLENKVKRIIRK